MTTREAEEALKVANLIMLKVPEQIQVEDLDEIIGLKEGEFREYHEYVPKYGDRCWRARGRLATIIYRDLGNGWCRIVTVESVERGAYEKIKNNIKRIEKRGWTE